MSEYGRRGSGDEGESARPERRDQSPRDRDNSRYQGDRFGDRGETPGSGRDGRSRKGHREGRPHRDRKPFDRRESQPGRGREDRYRRDDRGKRDDRPARDNRFTRDDRPRSGQHSGRDRGERSRREDRPRKDFRPRGTDRPDRSGRTERFERRDTGRGGKTGRPGKDDRTIARELLEAPQLPENAEFTDLDPEARRELRSLPKDLAERIGRHLVAAGTLIDDDPEAALAHARYAKAKASRIPVVREAAGLVAYHAGQWAEALSELRAVRRMTRTDTHVAVIADAERALGRPERALDIAKETDSATLPKEVEVELRIVAAGARRDLGQLDAAVVALQGPDLDPAQRHPWSFRLFYAYADNLAAAGRTEEAVRWFVHAAESDVEAVTDAAERAAELSE